ncbi:hypothetical protein [Bartonella tamiae]|uniref:Uncharacterized protein n=1 Tax=Bartonella tamiae Th239 TaxID=1094558 RepID=J0ZL32_9HYPH|nr:hypothetical protein [Bartonella tamiae]EJF89108.1 hypothetical protein ME5_01659 [Bartonella tamiae Th239]EJF95489.1 hypothetical protein MEG_00222 [Bartonella tamiae Th307]
MRKILILISVIIVIVAAVAVFFFMRDHAQNKMDIEGFTTNTTLGAFKKQVQEKFSNAKQDILPMGSDAIVTAFSINNPNNVGYDSQKPLDDIAFFTQTDSENELPLLILRNIVYSNGAPQPSLEEVKQNLIRQFGNAHEAQIGTQAHSMDWIENSSKTSEQCYKPVGQEPDKDCGVIMRAVLTMNANGQSVADVYISLKDSARYGTYYNILKESGFTPKF